MRLLFLSLMGAWTFMPNPLEARPVSYPGGWTFMTMNDGIRNSAHVHYSPNAKTSLGYLFENWRNKAFNLNAVQVNWLLKRWNQPDSQANVYLKSGIGLARGELGRNRETSLAGFSGLAADWENRRYFFAYENRYTEADSIDGFYQQMGRIGWAPYQGDYGDLHTWVMVQIDHMPGADESVMVTPLVRLFKNVHLFEVGMNNRGQILLNYIFRY